MDYAESGRKDSDRFAPEMLVRVGREAPEEIGSREYAERLGVSYRAFLHALAARRHRLEGREPPPSVGYPFALALSERISPPSYRRGRADRWRLSDVERFEAGLPPTPPERNPPRRRPDPELAAVEDPRLRQALEGSGTDPTARAVFAARYRLAGGGSPRERTPTLAEIGRELGITHQGATLALKRAERAVRAALAADAPETSEGGGQARLGAVGQDGREDPAP